MTVVIEKRIKQLTEAAKKIEMELFGPDEKQLTTQQLHEKATKMSEYISTAQYFMQIKEQMLMNAVKNSSIIKPENSGLSVVH